MLQIENEYGYFGSNNNLPEYIKLLWENTGLINIPYYVCDKAEKNDLAIGFVENAAIGLNPGIDADQWATKNQYYPHLPGLSSETYSGWYTHWGDKSFGSKSVDDYVSEISFLLSQNYSFAMYMVHGGTNFGFSTGGSGKGSTPLAYRPLVTSYDYDAPINEMG